MRACPRLLLAIFLAATVARAAPAAKPSAKVRETPLGRIPDGLVRRAAIASPDAQRVAAVAAQHGKQVVFVDGQPQQPWDAVRGLAWSADGKRLAYVAVGGGE